MRLIHGWPPAGAATSMRGLTACFAGRGAHAAHSKSGQMRSSLGYSRTRCGCSAGSTANPVCVPFVTRAVGRRQMIPTGSKTGSINRIKVVLSLFATRRTPVFAAVFGRRPTFGRLMLIVGELGENGILRRRTTWNTRSAATGDAQAGRGLGGFK